MILFQWVNDSEYFHAVPKNQKSSFHVWNTQWQTAIKLNEKQAVLRYSSSRVPFYILRWKLCNTRQKQNVRMMPCSTTRLREEQSSAVTIWWVRGKRQNTGGFPIIRTWRYYTWAFFLLLYLVFFFKLFFKKDDWGLSLSQSRCILFNQAKKWSRSGAVVSYDYDDVLSKNFT